MSTKKGIGILTFALNSEVDYERLAYLMALSYRATNPHALPMAVVVNDASSCMPKLKTVFDYVISKKEFDAVNEMHHESHLFAYTPFAETIKIESDILFTQNISHWIQHFRLWDLCFTTQVYGFDNLPADDTIYRKYIKDNNLPNTYNGIMYARFCRATAEYFRTVDQIFSNWNEEKKKFAKFDNFPPSTDFAMAMACHYNQDIDIGINSTGFPGFIHAKPWITHKSERPWHHEMKWSVRDPHTVIVNGIKAQWPIHYYDKQFCTDQLIEQYEQAI
jgi:hypothetical protein